MKNTTSQILLFSFLLLSPILCLAKLFTAESVRGEIIIKLNDGYNIHSLNIFKRNNIYIKRPIKLSYDTLYVVGYNSKLYNSSRAIKKILEYSTEISFAEPNYIYSINEIPNDPKFKYLWGLLNTGDNEPGTDRIGVVGADINAIEAWKITKGQKQVKIAVIDSGIDYNHPDLKDNIWVNIVEQAGKPGVDDDNNGFVDDIHGYDFSEDDGDPMDGHNHGTHCAGIIGAIHNNGIGIAGVMANVSLVPVRFLDDDGFGTTEQAIKAIDYATNLDVDVMSNSWGGFKSSDALREAIEVAMEKGIIFVTSAGNESQNNDNFSHFPSNFKIENIVSVAAGTIQDSMSLFSSYGPKTVHITAPGENILSTIRGSGYRHFSGTSMATPFVAGALGLLIAKEGRIPHQKMRERLMATSEQVNSLLTKTISGGRLNIFNLLSNIRPERIVPKASEWKTIILDDPFESPHPYPDKFSISKTYTIPGAKYIRVKLPKYKTEWRRDYIEIFHPLNRLVETISGTGTNHTSVFLTGDTVQINFNSDSVLNDWGFIIPELEIIKF